jgi:hypothetical protein
MTTVGEISQNAGSVAHRAGRPGFESSERVLMSSVACGRGSRSNMRVRATCLVVSSPVWWRLAGYPRDTRSMKLYHATSRASAERIKAEGFHGHVVFYGEHPATGGNWLSDNPKTESTLGLVLMSSEIPDDELADQPTRDRQLLEKQQTNDYDVDAAILNRHLESIQIES